MLMLMWERPSVQWIVEEGEQADEEEAGQEEQGGEQHRSLEQLSEVLLMRRNDSRCEDVEGEC